MNAEPLLSDEVNCRHPNTELDGDIFMQTHVLVTLDSRSSLEVVWKIGIYFCVEFEGEIAVFDWKNITHVYELFMFFLEDSRSRNPKSCLCVCECWYSKEIHGLPHGSQIVISSVSGKNCSM